MNQHMDSCELWNLATYNGLYTLHSGHGDLVPNALYGRNGKGLYFQDKNRYLLKVLDTATDVLYSGFALYIPPTVHNVPERIIGFFNLSLMHLGLYLQTNLRLSVYDINGLRATSDKALTGGTWHFIEFCAKIANAPDGWVQVWVNALDGAGLDTQNRWINMTNVNTLDAVFPDANIDSVKWQGGHSVQCRVYMDDLYLNDDNGAENTGRWGDTKLSVLLPNGDSAPSQFTPTGGGAHYTQIDEVPPDMADYVESATVGHIDRYEHENLLINGTIHTAYVRGYLGKTEAGARAGKIGIFSNATLDSSPDLSLTQAGQWHSYQVPKNPDGAVAWTPATINAAKSHLETSA